VTRPSRALSPIRTVWPAGGFRHRRTNRRPWSHTRSTGRWMRPGRGLTSAVAVDHRRFGISPSPASAWWVPH